MGKTKIEWATDSWNPIRARNIKTGKVGWHCEHVTTGCEICYAERFNLRLGTGLPFKPGHRNDIEIFLDQEMLTQPLRWKKPRRIFVGSMTDLFADFVPDKWIDQVFAVMALSQHHTFQVLTKRAPRMRKYFCDDACWRNRQIVVARNSIAGVTVDFGPMPTALPLPNVWLGVSAERQQEADERIPLLLQTPARIRFISAEPLLGPIDLTHVSFGEGDPRHKRQSLTGQAYLYSEGVDGHPNMTILTQLEKPMARLDWVIVGGESGPKVRPMHPDWARSIVQQCRAANIPVFVKQMGSRPTGLMLGNRKGSDPQEWPEDFRVREMPNVA